MSRLVFEAADVRRVVEHSLKHQSVNVLLVHDDGVYLMSDAEPRDIVTGERSFVAYAQGTHPVADVDWYETARSLVGGDDFGETLPWAEPLKAELDKGVATIEVEITEDSLALVTVVK